MRQNDNIKILVVRFKRIGDAILASPVCNSLKKTFPNSSIDYVLYEASAPLFENHPYIDKVICISKKEQENPFLYLKRVWQITRKKYDIIIDIMSTPKSEFFTLFSLGSPYRIGRVSKDKKRGYTYNYRQFEPENTENKVDKFLKQLLSPFEKDFQVRYAPELILSVSKEEKQEMRRRMETAGLSLKKPIIPFAILSRVPGKTYPIENMKKILSHCLQTYDAQFLFFYSPEQKEQIKKIEQELGYPNNLFTNLETKDMRELMALFANSTCYVGNEGGPRHLAQALGLPCFALFNPSADKKEWLPYPSESNVGMEPKDTLSFYNMTEEKYKTLTKEEAFALLTVPFVTEKLDYFLSKVLAH